MTRSSEIVSIFGQIEKLIAESMVKEGKLPKPFTVDTIPASVQFNKHGQKAFFALVITPQYAQEFNERVSELRRK